MHCVSQLCTRGLQASLHEAAFMFVLFSQYLKLDFCCDVLSNAKLPAYIRLTYASLACYRFKFVTLPGAAPRDTEEESRADLNLSLEEILKPFAGLSQLLGAYHEFKTMDDLNRMISKAADEFEAMREDKLNDGRPLGPLQVNSPFLSSQIKSDHKSIQTSILGQTYARMRFSYSGCMQRPMSALKGQLSILKSHTNCYIKIATLPHWKADWWSQG